MKNTSLENKKLRVLSQLRINCRAKTKEIAQSLHLNENEVLEIINMLEQQEIIRHVSLLDFTQTSHKIRAAFCFKTDNRRLKEFISKNEKINTLYEIINLPQTKEKEKQTLRYYIESVFRDITELADFAELLEDLGAEDIKEHLLITELKREDFLASEEKARQLIQLFSGKNSNSVA